MSDATLRKGEWIKHLHVTPLSTDSRFATTAFTSEGRILQKRGGPRHEDWSAWYDITPARERDDADALRKDV